VDSLLAWLFTCKKVFALYAEKSENADKLFFAEAMVNSYQEEGY
jgi:hypothetical protein